MTIRLGKDLASMLNPPNDGDIIDRNGDRWRIARNGNGMIVLRAGIMERTHPEFLDGKHMLEFCEWINSN